MEVLRCPSCGSNELDRLDAGEYRCRHCATGFILTRVETGFVDVVLVEAGRKKIDVVMALRDVPMREPAIEVIDLARAKQLTETTPCVVVPHVSLEVGERVKARLEKAGAIVELKPT